MNVNVIGFWGTNDEDDDEEAIKLNYDRWVLKAKRTYFRGLLGTNGNLDTYVCWQAKRGERAVI